MNFFLLAIVLLLGIALGVYLACSNATPGFIAQQVEQKTKNKQKILDFLQTNEKIKNNDVEKLTNVSNATAERYLSELEQEGKLTQHGTIGQSVFYTLNH